MKISDSPYAAGTTEHSQWVREVYIPSVSAERSVADSARAGAASIGRKLIDAREILPELSMPSLMKFTGSLMPDLEPWQSDAMRRMEAILLYGSTVIAQRHRTFTLTNISNC